MAPCASPPPEETPVPPGHRRTLNGKAVPVDLADQVIPPPRTGLQVPRATELGAEYSPSPCMHPQVADLLAELAAARERAARADERAERMEQVVLLQAQALAARPPATVHVPPAVPLSPCDMGGHVPLNVPPSQRDETPVVPRGTGAAKGGKGGSATATSEDERRRKRNEKKRRQRANKKKREAAAVDVAREVSPCPPVPLSPGDMSPPVVPPGDTSAPAAKPPVVRRKPKWLEPTTPSPDKEFLAWFEEERRRFHPNAADGLAPKLLSRWSEWFPRALAHPLIGGDIEKLRETCRRWFVDPWGRGLRTPCPASAFIADAVWPQHIPGQHEGSAPAQETPAEARRRASADVGRGDAPPALEVQDTPAGIAWGRVLGAMREAGGAPAYVAGQLQGRFRAVDLAGGCLVLEAPDKYALALLDEDFGGAALKAAVGTLGLEFRVSLAGQPADAHTGGPQ